MAAPATPLHYSLGSSTVRWSARLLHCLQRCVSAAMEARVDPDLVLEILEHWQFPVDLEIRPDDFPYLDEGLCIQVRLASSNSPSTELCSEPYAHAALRSRGGCISCRMSTGQANCQVTCISCQGTRMDLILRRNSSGQHKNVLLLRFCRSCSPCISHGMST